MYAWCYYRSSFLYIHVQMLNIIQTVPSSVCCAKTSTESIVQHLQYMGNMFCVAFQRVHLKFHTIYLTHILKDVILYKVELVGALRLRGRVFETPFQIRSTGSPQVDVRSEVRNCGGVLVAYSVTDRSSLSTVRRLVGFVRNVRGRTDIPMVLVGMEILSILSP